MALSNIVVPAYAATFMNGDVVIVPSGSDTGTVTSTKLQILDTSAASINSNGGATLRNGLTVSAPSITSFGTLVTVANAVLQQSGSGALLGQVWPDYGTKGGFGGAVQEMFLVSNLNLTSFTPVTGLSSNFAMRLSGWISPVASEVLTLYVTVNNGVRVVFNHKLAVDAYTGTTSATYNYTTPAALTAGTYYPITIEYYSDTGTDSLIVQWSSTSVTKATIPSTALFYDGNSASPNTLGSFVCDGNQSTIGSIASTGTVTASAGLYVSPTVGILPNANSLAACVYTMPASLPSLPNSAIGVSSSGQLSHFSPLREYYFLNNTWTLLPQAVTYTFTTTTPAGGKATIYMTSDQTSTGTILFASIIRAMVTPTAAANTTVPSNVPQAALEPWSSDFKSIVVDVVHPASQTIAVAAATTAGYSAAVTVVVTGVPVGG